MSRLDKITKYALSHQLRAMNYHIYKLRQSERIAKWLDLAIAAVLGITVGMIIK